VGCDTEERGYCVVNSVQIDTGTEWDIRQGKGVFLFSAACKLKLELRAISDRKMGFVLSTACKLKLELIAISERARGAFY
jgi:hypothetical protein